MPSFFDLQRYAATGIASPDMTAFDKARALAAFGGGTVHTLTGIPPLSFPSDGTPLISLSMIGNGQQTGTPSPQSIIIPEFVGARTANLIDYNVLFGDNPDRTSTYFIYYKVVLEPNTQYTMTTNVPNFMLNQCSYMFGTQNVMSAADYGVYTNEPKTITSNPDGSVFIACRIIPPYNTRWATKQMFDSESSYIMLNLGSSPLPYEPYGWKIPISCGGQTVPVYLGQTQTVRRVRKLVLTGTENWQTYTQVSNTYRVSIGDTQSIGNPAICSHFENAPISTISSGNFTVGSTWIYIRYADVADVTDFKAYLASEYAAGHPVTIWYVLATPETAIANEPLCKIGDYADELSSEDAAVTIPTVKGQNTLTVDTDLQPSEMTIKYRE